MEKNLGKRKVKWQIVKRTRKGKWQNWYFPQSKKSKANKILRKSKFLKNADARIIKIEKKIERSMKI